MDVALATYSGAPDLDADDAALVPALASRGLRAAAVRWDDERFEWSSVRACVIRSTWDYHERREEFVAWADRAGAATRLFNDAATVRWNTHKGYLRELEARGVSIVPTTWVAAGERADLGALLASRGWDDAVIKPAVSANARDTIRVRGGGDLARAQAHLDAIVGRALDVGAGAGGDAMLQPYLASVETYGERSLIFFDGEFSHAIRKHPQLPLTSAALTSGGTGAIGGEPSAEAEDSEVRFARDVLAAAQRETLYARVDIARSETGALALMELELTEPSLFLAKSPGACAVDRFAAAIAARLARI